MKKYSAIGTKILLSMKIQYIFESLYKYLIDIVNKHMIIKLCLTLLKS